MVFFISTSTRQFLSLEGLTSLTIVLYRHKLTWQQVDVQGCKKLHATVRQKLASNPHVMTNAKPEERKA